MRSRRAFIAMAGASLVPGLVAAQSDQKTVGDSSGAQDEADRLFSPNWTGAQRDSLTDLDNDPIIIATERRLKCTCGCTLDIYTCRTTDFTCTFSPALHKEVLGLHTEGKTPEEIIAFFVAREGEAILMAPPAEGFNLAGYLVPGVVMATSMLALVAWISRRKEALATDVSPSVDSETTAEPISDSARERLRKALDDVEV